MFDLRGNFQSHEAKRRVFKIKGSKIMKKHTNFILFDLFFPQLNSWWFLCSTGGPKCTRRHVFFGSLGLFVILFFYASRLSRWEQKLICIFLKFKYDFSMPFQEESWTTIKLMKMANTRRGKYEFYISL